MPKRQCATCIYSHPVETGYECRLNPPTVIEVGTAYTEERQLSVWPIVGSTDWCGQWRDDTEGAPDGKAD